ncbi:MAG TPA: YcxB family protein [Capsulimonadaceae bacterium]|nr:YcxB family protein [Capsulimonadaceae bacterium]
MQVSYILEGRDYWNYSKHLLFQAPETWARWLGFTLVLPCVVAFLAFQNISQVPVRLAVIIAVLIVWLSYRLLYAKRYAYKEAEKASEEERRISLSIAEDRLILQAEGVRAELVWQNIRQISQTPEYIYLFFSRSQGLIVPKRSFASSEASSVFYSTALRFKANEKPPSSEPWADGLASPSDAIAVDYQLSLDDYYHFLKKYTALGAEIRTTFVWLLGMIFILIGATTLAVSITEKGSAGVANLTGLFYGLCAIALGAVPIWLRSSAYFHWRARRTARTYPGLVGRHAIVLLPDQLVECTPFNKTALSWKSFQRVEEDDRAIYLFQAPSAAYIIPKQAFATDGAATAFLHQARTDIGSAQGTERGESESGRRWPPAPIRRS